MHVHLDPVGGIAGDMFVAAILDAWPELGQELAYLLNLAGLPDTVTAAPRSYCDHGLQGTQYQVSNSQPSHTHSATGFRNLRAQLQKSDLPPGVKDKATAIFTLLAQAEGAVHGINVDDVHFHEVGAWDSIADIVASAFLIDQLQVDQWSTSPLPLGSGQVRTTHGILPVPAPATVRLLKGFLVRDDGRDGERVTPTGAAILKYLSPTPRFSKNPLALGRTGIGFGTKRFADLPNMLRVMALESTTQCHLDHVAVLTFEIDDQTAEDLAVGLAHLRQLAGVIDVIQLAVFGKQGRLTTQIQLLAQPEALETVISRCFIETTTLGLRWQIVQRAVLERRLETVDDANQSLQVKVAQRPQGIVTGKTDIRPVIQTAGGFAARKQIRDKAEQTILKRFKEENNDF